MKKKVEEENREEVIAALIKLFIHILMMKNNIWGDDRDSDETKWRMGTFTEGCTDSSSVRNQPGNVEDGSSDGVILGFFILSELNNCYNHANENLNPRIDPSKGLIKKFKEEGLTEVPRSLSYWC